MTYFSTAKCLEAADLKWSSSQRVLHWSTVFILFTLVGPVILINLHPDFPSTRPGSSLWNFQYYIYNLHYILGIILLIITIIRIVLRAIYKSPASPAVIPRWQIIFAFVVHTLLYVNLIGMATFGLLMIYASGYVIQWNILRWPVEVQFAERDADLLATMIEFHFWGAISLLLLLLLHVCGALKHHFFDGIPFFRRMWVIERRPLEEGGERLGNSDPN